jgi:hypothetical protein
MVVEQPSDCDPLALLELDGVFTFSLFLPIVEVAVEDPSNYKHKQISK